MISRARTSDDRRRPRGSAVLFLGAVAVVGYVMTYDWAISYWSYLAISCATAAAAIVGVRRSGSGRVGALLAAGVVLSASGDAVWQGYVTWRGVEPDLSLADIGYLASYVALGAALLVVVRQTDRRRLDIDGVIDVAVIAVIALVVQWNLSVGAILTDSSIGILPRVVWGAYPTLDAVLLALVVRAVVDRRLRGTAGVLVALGVGCWLLSDLAYTIPAAASWSAWLDSGWLLGAVILAAATWQGPQVRAALDATRVGRVRYASIVVTLVPLLVPWIIEVSGWARGTDPNPIPLVLASATLIAIAFVRTARSLRAEAEARARVQSRERYERAVAQNSSDAVAVFGRDGRILGDAPELADLVGHAGAPTGGVDPADVLDPVDVDAWRVMFRRCLRTPGQRFEGELRVRHADGEDQWLGVRLVNLLHDPDVEGVVVNLHDISDRKRAEAELVHQAFHDGLTGLANRALFTDRVEHALRRSSREGTVIAVVFLDLDAFKNVNDTLGHGAGDDLLREVSGRLVSAVRSGDTVARLGGDEFAVLIEQGQRIVEEAEAVADRILATLSRPVLLGDQAVTVSASLGIAHSDADATSVSLLRDADVAMYQAKAMGKGQRVVYEPDMRTAAVERVQIEADVGRALEHGQLRVVYQPVIELDTEDVVGFEALLRWQHPTLGNVAPDSFIPIAEETGAIVPIGRWVLAEACGTAARWRREFPTDPALTMAINLSGRQLADDDLVSDVIEVLDRTGLDPTTLVLEVTETALVEDTELAARRLKALRDIGIRIAIDDFGTGYSSLSYLRQFPVDILKIDRSFIDGITERDALPPIVRGLLDLGRTLELSMVAEGVEHDVQRDSLRDQHCGLAQGFLFARPLDADDAELLVLGIAGERDGAARP